MAGLTAALLQYIFETTYDQKALTAMAKCLRKTVRSAHSKKSHLFGGVIVVLAVLLPFMGDDGFVLDLRSVVTWAAAAAIVLALLFEDRLNGSVAKKRMLKGTEAAKATFDPALPETFLSETAVGKPSSGTTAF